MCTSQPGAGRQPPSAQHDHKHGNDGKGTLADCRGCQAHRKQPRNCSFSALLRPLAEQLRTPCEPPLFWALLGCVLDISQFLLCPAHTAPAHGRPTWMYAARGIVDG